jgi:hypothetical protein
LLTAPTYSKWRVWCIPGKQLDDNHARHAYADINDIAPSLLSPTYSKWRVLVYTKVATRHSHVVCADVQESQLLTAPTYSKWRVLVYTGEATGCEHAMHAMLV